MSLQNSSVCFFDIVVFQFISACKGLGEGESPESPWRKLGDRTMRQVAVGGGGVWGVAKDNSLWFRGVAGRTDTTVGDNWTKMQSAPLKLIYVGPNSVWGLDMDNHCVVRTEVKEPETTKSLKMSLYDR